VMNNYVRLLDFNQQVSEFDILRFRARSGRFRDRRVVVRMNINELQ
jgi:hypothetical protein